MPNQVTDRVAETLRAWTTDLTVAFAAAGFGCHYQSHTGSSSIRLGRLVVTQHGNEGPQAIRYHVDFERKLVISHDGSKREAVTALEVYNPKGGLHVHIRKHSPETVSKIVSYAQQTITVKRAREEQNLAQQDRSKKGYDLLRDGTQGFVIPDWVRVAPNTQNALDEGTFRLTFSDHRVDWPLARLSVEQAKQVIDTIRAVTCSHKFVDSKMCLKCGWEPPVEPPSYDGWRPASVPVPPELVNDPNSVLGITKMLLLCVSFNESPVRGWYYGGLLKEFRMEGSPSAVQPTHWMPLPVKPGSH